MNWLTQRIEDWQREQRIASLARQTIFAMKHGHKRAARMLNAEMMEECRSRSASQIARMERRFHHA